MHYGYFFNLISNFASIIGTAIGGILENKIGFNFTTLLGTLICLACNIFFFKVANIWLCYVLIFIIGLGQGIGTSLLGKNLMLYMPKKKATLTSVLGIILVCIMAPISLMGEKIIAGGGETLKEGELTSGELAKIYQEYLASILEGFLITEMAEPNSSASLLNSVIDSK
jgi:predicted MFS family arabinose efflux permease